MSIVRPALVFDNVTVVTNNILRSPELSPAEKGVLCYILSHKAGYELTMKQVLGENRAGRHAIDTALEGLESRGYLARTRKRDEESGRMGGYDWAVTIDHLGNPQVTPSAENPALEKPALDTSSGNDASSQVTPSAGFSTVEKTAPKNLNLVLELDLEVKNPSPTATAVDGLFDRFYANYPKKVNKIAARKNFEKAITKLKVDPEVLIKASADYAAHEKERGTEKRYIKGPDVWLSKGCWEDELASERIRNAGYKGPYQNPDDDSVYDLSLADVLRARAAN